MFVPPAQGPDVGPRSTLSSRLRRLVAAVATSAAALSGCVAAGPEAAAPGTGRSDPLLIVGDSNTAASNSWATQVPCVRSRWAKPGLALLHRTKQAGPALRHRIGEVMTGRRGHRVVVMLGTNDMLGPAPSPQEYSRIASEFRAHGATSVVFAVPPPVGPGHWASRDMARGWTRWRAAVLATPGSVDFVYPLGDRLDPGEQIGDGIHLNRSAQRSVGVAATRALC